MRAKRAKIFVVHILIFPQILLETKAINTNKCVPLWFPGYCGSTDLNGCVGACMHFSLLFEPLKIYHHTDSRQMTYFKQ